MRSFLTSDRSPDRSWCRGMLYRRRCTLSCSVASAPLGVPYVMAAKKRTGLRTPAYSLLSQPAVHPLGQPHMNSMGPPLSSTCDRKSTSDPGFPTPDRTTNVGHGYSVT